MDGGEDAKVLQIIWIIIMDLNEAGRSRRRDPTQKIKDTVYSNLGAKLEGYLGGCNSDSILQNQVAAH